MMQSIRNELFITEKRSDPIPKELMNYNSIFMMSEHHSMRSPVNAKQLKFRRNFNLNDVVAYYVLPECIIK